MTPKNKKQKSKPLRPDWLKIHMLGEKFREREIQRDLKEIIKSLYDGIEKDYGTEKYNGKIYLLDDLRLALDKKKILKYEELGGSRITTKNCRK